MSPLDSINSLVDSFYTLSVDEREVMVTPPIMETPDYPPKLERKIIPIGNYQGKLQPRKLFTD